jgi:hypothetical protein
VSIRRWRATVARFLLYRTPRPTPAARTGGAVRGLAMNLYSPAAADIWWSTWLAADAARRVELEAGLTRRLADKVRPLDTVV